MQATYRRKLDLGERLAQVREHLNARRAEWSSLSDKSGVDYYTVSRIAGGKTGNPGILTVSAIEAALRGE